MKDEIIYYGLYILPMAEVLEFLEVTDRQVAEVVSAFIRDNGPTGWDQGHPREFVKAIINGLQRDPEERARWQAHQQICNLLHDEIIDYHQATDRARKMRKRLDYLYDQAWNTALEQVQPGIKDCAAGCNI